MARRDLIVSFLGGMPERILSKFRDRPLTINSPVQQKAIAGYPGGREGYRKWLAEHASNRRVIAGLFRAAGGSSSDEIGRVCVHGFSNGCIGVDEVLAYDDAFQIDCAMAIDGIHGAYQNPAQKILVPSAYKNWYNFGYYTATKNPEENPNYPVCVITHSSIVPGSFPSTTESATYIWNIVEGRVIQNHVPVLTETCGYDCVPRQRLNRLESIAYETCATKESNGCCGTNGGVCKSNQGDVAVTFSGLDDGWYRKSILNNFHVFGWYNKGVTGYPDHLFQAQRVMPAMGGEFLVRRWGGQCGTGPVSGTGIFGLGADNDQCLAPQGTVYGQGDEKLDYFPEIANQPLYVPGHTVVNLPSIRPMVPDFVLPLAQESSVPLVDVAAGVAGVAAGYFGARYFLKGRK
jgi:hypothetical protein